MTDEHLHWAAPRVLSTHIQKSAVMIFVPFTGHWVKEFHHLEKTSVALTGLLVQ